MRFESASQATLATEFIDSLKRAFDRVSNWRRASIGLKGMLLYWLLPPLLLATLLHAAFGNLQSVVLGIVASALWLTSAKLNRLSIRDDLLAAKQRFVASGLPWKRALSIVLYSTAVGLIAGGLADHGGLAAVIYSLLAAVGLYLAYPKLDHSLSKENPIHIGLSPGTLESLRQAEGRLIHLRRLGQKIGQAELGMRLDRIADTGAEILQRLAKSPDLLPKSRRFLHVHLAGAERVAKHYAETHRFLRKRPLEEKFRETLELIEKSFTDHQHDLDNYHLERLDIQITVLQKQLRNHPTR